LMERLGAGVRFWRSTGARERRAHDRENIQAAAGPPTQAYQQRLGRDADQRRYRTHSSGTRRTTRPLISRVLSVQ